MRTFFDDPRPRVADRDLANVLADDAKAVITDGTPVQWVPVLVVARDEPQVEPRHSQSGVDLSQDLQDLVSFEGPRMVDHQEGGSVFICRSPTIRMRWASAAIPP